MQKCTFGSRGSVGFPKSLESQSFALIVPSPTIIAAAAPSIATAVGVSSHAYQRGVVVGGGGRLGGGGEDAGVVAELGEVVATFFDLAGLFVDSVESAVGEGVEVIFRFAERDETVAAGEPAGVEVDGPDDLARLAVDGVDPAIAANIELIAHAFPLAAVSCDSDSTLAGQMFSKDFRSSAIAAWTLHDDGGFRSGLMPP